MIQKSVSDNSYDDLELYFSIEFYFLSFPTADSKTASRGFSI